MSLLGVLLLIADDCFFTDAAFNDNIDERNAARERFRSKVIPKVEVSSDEDEGEDDGKDKEEDMEHAAPVRKPAVAPVQVNGHRRFDEASTLNTPDLEEPARHAFPTSRGMQPTLSPSTNPPAPTSDARLDLVAESTTSTAHDLDRYRSPTPPPPALSEKERRKLKKKEAKREWARSA
ncbi:hypothetical protein CLAFUW4_07804 [Fulvia fulva]|uniref:Uncharacterized protein n=1 Tax=Passalora fulva TaxID=5499 RepID=A0A9Q8P6D1_PASFU|nr:uncharacterized protein CLAFUR5_07928 [Fulvia fulva]KAK4629561.1 hypothetical protein CLAFUR4_07809 [Fulvia fulva]KAK4629873.1 hypothetical protein CLAFUR0_07806 [Fulvia fulva]UJO14821.1 hypothetical protein CLAFUR5_07928 [Fulvia fulva]WPV12696.1 hypothetical protein CLAFUW4_07804 [Fulvia fulva]WPV27032.1 hypothetical protein CLAFUW7_07805 [Fulvia fulva]